MIAFREVVASRRYKLPRELPMQNRYDKGMEVKRAVLGDTHVDRAVNEQCFQMGEPGFCRNETGGRCVSLPRSTYFSPRNWMQQRPACMPHNKTLCAGRSVP